MRKLLASAAVLAVSASAAYAESADSLQIQINGTVEDICTIAFNAAPTDSGLNNFSVVASDITGDTAQVFGEVVILNTNDPSDPSIGDIENFQVDFTADFFCNGDYEATIEAANGSFDNTDDVNNTGDFSNRLGYEVTAFFDSSDETENPSPFTLDANGATTSTGPINGSQHNGQVTFRLSAGQSDVIDTLTNTSNGSLNLISGLYEEAITISFVQDGTVPAAAFSVAAPDQALFSTAAASPL